MDKEREEYRKRMEERIGSDMSAVLKFVPQCSECKFNDPPDCEVFGEKPEKYRLNIEDCPSRDTNNNQG